MRISTTNTLENAQAERNLYYSREITICSRELFVLKSSEDKFGTTFNEMVALSKKLEYGCDIILNTETATFEFANKPRRGTKTSCNIKPDYKYGKKKSYTVGNIHIHPENLREGGNIGCSEDDLNASISIRGVVMNYEKGQFHYYKNGYGSNVYNGATDAKSIITGKQ